MLIRMEFSHKDRANLERLVGRMFTVSEQLSDIQDRLERLELRHGAPRITTLQEVRDKVYRMRDDVGSNLDIEA